MMASTPVEFGLLAFSSLFAMVDPVATAPVFVQMTRSHAERRRQMAVRASLAAGTALLLFAVAGGAIFSFFGITVPAFQIVGGLLLSASSLNVLRGTETHGAPQGVAPSDPSIVPIGIPLIAGAGSLSTVMVLSGQARGQLHQAALAGAIVVTILLTMIVLILAPAIVTRLGQTGQEVISKVMALLSAVIGVQFIINGSTAVVMQLLQHLK